MLTHIHIRDFAIIDELELELDSGFCALTGETGAGKSILVDALGLVLGDRADSTAIRDGAERAELSVTLDVRAQPEAGRWLADNGFESIDDCLLRRVIARDGRTRAWINGSPATLALLKELGEMLVDIHGQHEHQSLLRTDAQRRLLDDFADNTESLQQLATLYQDWRRTRQQLDDLSTQGEARAQRLDLLRFQIRELETLDSAADEPAALAEEQQRLAQADRLRDTALAAWYALDGGDEDTLQVRLGRLIRELEDLQDVDPRLDEYRALLTDAQAQLQTASEGLQRYGESVDLDPERLQWVEERLAAIDDLARKHRVPAEELPDRLAALSAELEKLEGPEQDLDALEQRLQALEQEYRSLALTIREARRQAAGRLGAAVTEAMQDLGMSGGRFEIEVASREQDTPSPSGLDRVEFQVSANPGQTLRPLARVASGGELSRISLAIQMVAAHSLRTPVLIFDEVDVGIGGAVAEVVGRQLRALGENRQALCVTHLPQVAAQANRHYRVSKWAIQGVTRACIEALRDRQARTDEIARMLGGVELTAQTRAHAREMIDKAKKA